MRAVSEPTYTPGLVASSSATASGPSPTAEQAAAAEAERRGRTMSRTFNSIHSASEGNLRSSVHFSSEDYFGPDAGSGTRRSLSRALSAGSSRSATRSGANSSGSRPPHPPMSHRQASQSQQVVFLSVSIATAFHALAARMALAAPTSMSASDAGGTHAPATNVEWIPRRAPNASLSHPFLFTTTRTEDDAEELPQRFWRRAADERGEVELQFAPSDLAAKENWVSFEADADASRDHTKPKPPPRRGPPDWERIIGRISAWACATLYLTSRLPQLWWNVCDPPCSRLTDRLTGVLSNPSHSSGGSLLRVSRCFSSQWLSVAICSTSSRSSSIHSRTTPASGFFSSRSHTCSAVAAHSCSTSPLSRNRSSTLRRAWPSEQRRHTRLAISAAATTRRCQLGATEPASVRACQTKRLLFLQMGPRGRRPQTTVAAKARRRLGAQLAGAIVTEATRRTRAHEARTCERQATRAAGALVSMAATRQRCRSSTPRRRLQLSMHLRCLLGGDLVRIIPSAQFQKRAKAA